MEVFLQKLNNFPAIVSFIILYYIIVALSFIIRWLWDHVFLRLSQITSTNLDKIIFSATKTPVQCIFLAAGFEFAWNLYGKAIIKQLKDIPGIEIVFVQKVIDHLSFMFLSFSIVFFFWRVILALLDWYEKDIAVKTSTKIDEKIIPYLRKILKVCFVIVIIMFISDHFGLPLSKLWAAAGIGSIAIAFAAKDTLANIISGVIIFIDRPFLVGDRIELADGIIGDVTEIGLRSTRIMSFDNTIYIIPNDEISNQRITNHSYPDSKVINRHTIGVAYGTDLEKVKTILKDILANHPKILKGPAWSIYFTKFDDSSLTLLVVYWVSDYREKFTITDEINMRIKKRFEEETIVIPFPQRDINIVSRPGST